MSMNKFMHPRNIYKTPPDFLTLALRYPTFKAITSLDVNGKLTVNFKDENALRELTRCLLKNDFNLDIILPSSKLIPTLPLRLNYILWIEDLMSLCKFTDVTGLDIGCGASCIYPILAASKNKWKMIALENNAESFQIAQQNVSNNNLNTLITIHLNEHFFPNTPPPSTIHFTMCNPPFYASADEMDLSMDDNNRTGKRSAPNNAPTGSHDELIVEGGECEFIRRIIDGTVKYRSAIKIFTTMIGHKRNVTKILQYLQTNGISNFTQTEFCQGRTTRWAIAWSFDPSIYLRLAPSYGPNFLPNKSFSFILPNTSNNNNNSHSNVLKSFREIEYVLQKIKLDFIEIELINDRLARAKIIAANNTWSNQRRQRREQHRHHSQQIVENTINMEIEQNEIGAKRDLNAITTDESIESSDKRLKLNETEWSRIVDPTNDYPALVVLITVRKVKSAAIQVELEYLSGRANVDGVHQLLQYIINLYKKNVSK